MKKLSQEEINIREKKIADKGSLKWVHEISKKKVDENFMGAQDEIPKEILDNIDKYPDSPFIINPKYQHKIIDIKIKPNGSGEIRELILDGKENDPRERSEAGILIPSDEELLG